MALPVTDRVQADLGDTGFRPGRCSEALRDRLADGLVVRVHTAQCLCSAAEQACLHTANSLPLGFILKALDEIVNRVTISSPHNSALNVKIRSADFRLHI